MFRWGQLWKPLYLLDLLCSWIPRECSSAIISPGKYRELAVATPINVADGISGRRVRDQLELARARIQCNLLGDNDFKLHVVHQLLIQNFTQSRR
jgi:hypothetical protein